MTLRTPVLLLFLCVAAGCASPVQWRELSHDDRFDVIWDEFTLIASRAGYDQDARKTDRGLRTFVSQWRENAAPFRFGRRTRLNAEMERLDEEPGWLLRFHIESQTIGDMAGGFDPIEEDWTEAGQDYNREEVLLSQLKIALGKGLDDLQVDFQRR